MRTPYILDSQSVLCTEVMAGNLHEVSDSINKRGLSDFVLVMDYSGGYTSIVFRIPKQLLKDHEEQKNSSLLKEN